MKGKGSNGEMYLEMYWTKAKRWINQCVICQRKGYKPEMPIESSNGSLLFSNIRQYFEPLQLDDSSLCEQCGKALKQT
jgi:hypothetical protein